MSDSPKVQQNFHAPVTGVAGNVEGDMIIRAPDPKITVAAQQLTHLLNKLRTQHPNATNSELIDILNKGFETMSQKNPQKWKSWQNILSLLFAAGQEGIRVWQPLAGIPIAIANRLYEIYQQNQKQLPDG